MRKVTAIVRRGRLEQVERRLEAECVEGMTVCACSGFGEHTNYFGSSLLVPHVLIQIFVEPDCTDDIVRAIREAAYTGEVGDGVVAVGEEVELHRVREH